MSFQAGRVAVASNNSFSTRCLLSGIKTSGIGKKSKVYHLSEGVNSWITTKKQDIPSAALQYRVFPYSDMGNNNVNMEQIVDIAHCSVVHHLSQ